MKAESVMYSAEEFRDFSRRSLWILMSAILLGSAVTMTVVWGLGKFRDQYVEFVSRGLGEDVAAICLLPAVFASVVPLLSMLCWAERKTRLYNMVCPACSASLTRLPTKVMATRRCWECGVQVVAGPRTHSDQVYLRYRRMV